MAKKQTSKTISKPEKKRTASKVKTSSGTTTLGFEETLWQTADKLRGHMDAAVYKHTVLGLVFLKYVSDSFLDRFNELVAEGDGFEEERDAYSEKNVFWVPKPARWDNIKNNAKKPEIGKIIDDAMVAIEKENKSLNRNENTKTICTGNADYVTSLTHRDSSIPLPDKGGTSLEINHLKGDS